MSDNAARLLKLAQAEFPDLTAPEREVLRCATTGEWADLLQWGKPPPKPKKYNHGGGPLPSKLVTWLCTDARAKRLVHRKGLRIANATLDAELDLERAVVPFFFGLRACRLPSLNAQGATLNDNLYLKLCRVDGNVNLLGATISGQLQCDGAWFLKRSGFALIADGATIGSNVYLSQGFRAVGAVRLLGAQVTGQLDCKKGCFLNRKGNALHADGATIGNNVYLSLEFRAVGAVRLPGAKITGQLDCQGGSFWVAKEDIAKGDNDALNLECATILDTIFLEPENVHGEISLHHTEAKGLQMLAPALATASLNLGGAKVGLLLDARDSWPAQGKLQLDGLHYESVHRDSPMTAKERLDWLGRQPQDQFLPQPYEELAAFFQRAGHDSEAKDVRIAKERARWRHFDNPIKKAWWIFKDVTIRYGHRPHRAIYGLGFLILFGWLVFCFGSKGMTQSVSYNYNSTEPPGITGKAIAADYPKFRPFVYSIDVALPIVDLQQERYWMPNANHNGPDVPFFEKGWFLWGINWFMVLSGWILATLGIAGATGIIRKD